MGWFFGKGRAELRRIATADGLIPNGAYAAWSGRPGAMTFLASDIPQLWGRVMVASARKENAILRELQKSLGDASADPIRVETWFHHVLVDRKHHGIITASREKGFALHLLTDCPADTVDGAWEDLATWMETTAKGLKIEPDEPIRPEQWWNRQHNILTSESAPPAIVLGYVLIPGPGTMVRADAIILGKNGLGPVEFVTAEMQEAHPKILEGRLAIHFELARALNQKEA